MKIAMYETISGSAFPLEVTDYIEGNDEYIRISEIIEINFKDLPDKDVMNNKIKSIDKKINETLAEHNIRINNLKDIKNKLLALPNKK